MKIEFTKNSWISNIELSYCREGFWKGAMMLIISLTGNALDFEFATEVFERLLKLPMPRRKIVRITGFFNPNDANLDTIIRAFKTYGFIVQVVTNGTRTYPWMDAVDWHIVSTSAPLILIDCSEIWYSPPAVEPIPEPIIPPNPNKPLFLYIAKGNSVSATNDFVIESKNNWNLL